MRLINELAKNTNKDIFEKCKTLDAIWIQGTQSSLLDCVGDHFDSAAWQLLELPCELPEVMRLRLLMLRELVEENPEDLVTALASAIARQATDKPLASSGKPTSNASRKAS